MPRRLVGGLIQAAVPLTDPAVPIEKIRQAAIDAHIPLIEDAGRLVVAEMDLDMIEEVRRVWQFYRDRRPESYRPMAEQLP